MIRRTTIPRRTRKEQPGMPGTQEMPGNQEMPGTQEIPGTREIILPEIIVVRRRDVTGVQSVPSAEIVTPP